MSALEDQDFENQELLEDEDDAPKEHDTEGVWLISYADMMTLLMGFFALLTAMSSFNEEQFKETAEEAALYFGGEVITAYEDLGKAIQALITEKGLEEQVQIKVSKTGIVLTFEGTLFFSSGSFELREGATLLMNQLLKILDQEAKDKRYLIEGHTDDIPINQGIIRSNWELSSLRATAVARLFERYNFKREQILTIGFGETRPILRNRDEQGNPISKNQDQNRRVVLKVMDNLPF
jgi:chemotaxis protein MotB